VPPSSQRVLRAWLERRPSLQERLAWQVPQAPPQHAWRVLPFLRQVREPVQPPFWLALRELALQRPSLPEPPAWQAPLLV
jgi:hypothetical protein